MTSVERPDNLVTTSANASLMEETNRAAFQTRLAVRISAGVISPACT
jgi:hypothetical protein